MAVGVLRNGRRLAFRFEVRAFTFTTVGIFVGSISVDVPFTARFIFTDGLVVLDAAIE